MLCLLIVVHAAMVQRGVTRKMPTREIISISKNQPFTIDVNRAVQKLRKWQAVKISKNDLIFTWRRLSNL